MMYIKANGELADMWNSTTKMLLPQSPPTHSLINAHHLCTKFNFVLLIAS